MDEHNHQRAHGSFRLAELTDGDEVQVDLERQSFYNRIHHRLRILGGWPVRVEIAEEVAVGEWRPRGTDPLTEDDLARLDGCLAAYRRGIGGARDPDCRSVARFVWRLCREGMYEERFVDVWPVDDPVTLTLERLIESVEGGTGACGRIAEPALRPDRSCGPRRRSGLPEGPPFWCSGIDIHSGDVIDAMGRDEAAVEEVKKLVRSAMERVHDDPAARARGKTIVDAEIGTLADELERWVRQRLLDPSPPPPNTAGSRLRETLLGARARPLPPLEDYRYGALASDPEVELALQATSWPRVASQCLASFRKVIYRERREA